MSAAPHAGMPAWRRWLLAVRPRTLPVAVAPVLLGTAVAASGPGARAGPALAALAGALLLQVGSNLANDLFDHEKGADTHERLGPPRASALGLIPPTQMRAGMALVFGAAAAVGLYLFAVAGWPVLAAGALAIAAALAYTGGPWPFGYKGLGDPAVFLFFGVVAVVGTDYVQTGRLSVAALLASLPIGALATAILVVNNLRDIDSDRKAGKHTLAVRLGRRGARLEYTGLLVFAYALLPVHWLVCGRSPWVLLPLLSLPRALTLARTLWTTQAGPPLNAALAGTAQLTLLFALLLALGWLA